ncbi:MAG: amidohydrolase [Cardiobacteriaceae bacterium]|nr:amidohydrolase [Cardiobacteriaceae bacterium]
MQKYLDQLVRWRRYLHQRPELSFHEVETSRFIAEEMAKLKHTHIERLTPTSVVVVFKTDKPGAKIGLRADIDALPVQEERDELPFKSQVDGKMHACGHDGHTAILMTACQYFDEHFDELSGEIHAIFQHAEELPPGGAREMVATGYFDDFDFIYGQHLMSTSETGILDIKDGSVSANSDSYNLSIHGKGGHAAMPDQTIDPVLIGAQFVTLLQGIVARRISPLDAVVISNTVFHAGTIHNVIPDSVELKGTVRTTSEVNRQFARENIERLAKSLCEAAGASYIFDYQIGYSGVWNDPEKTATVRELARQRYGDKVISLPPMMGAEDFSAFSQRVPATYAIVGSGSNGFNFPHHHPKFGLDEDSFAIGLQMMLDVGLNSARFKK